MHCPLSEGYIQNASHSSGLARLEKEALADISAVFNLQVTHAISDRELRAIRYQIFNTNPNDLFIRNIRGGGFFLDAPQRVFVIPNSEWLINRRLTGPPSHRGSYLYNQAAILLQENGDNQNSWCRKTIIHEILHSASIFSRAYSKFSDVRIWHQQKSLREGITETLTGYILQKRHPDCYHGWHSNQLYRCSISYPGNVRIWCSFCQCVGISELAQFYLSNMHDLSKPWKIFNGSIQLKGFKDFSYELNERQPFNETKFRDICVATIPSFGEIYDSMTRSFDFTRIP